MDYFELFGALAIGLLAGFIGAIAGGGGLISIPFLLFLGVSPQITLATSKFGGLGMCFGALVKFIKEKQINWPVAVTLSIFGVIASFIGSRLLLTTDQTILEKAIGVLLFLLVPTLFVKKNFGITKVKVNKKLMVVGTIVYFLLSILASVFGGLGIFMITSVIYFFGLSIIEASATELVSYAALSVSAVIIYILNGIVDYPLGIALMIGNIIGGYAGAHTAIKKSNNWVKIVFALVIIASAIKILIK